MPDFKVLAVNHTSFTVSDLDRSIGFFRDALGFTVTSKSSRDPKIIEAVNRKFPPSWPKRRMSEYCGV